MALSTVMAALVAAAGTLLELRPAQAQGTGLTGGVLELTDVFFAEGDRIFGPSETITVSGVVPYIPTVLCPSGGDGEDRFDFFPSADLYVIEDPVVPFGPLKDVLDTPNRVIATGTGAFVEELVAITKPLGNLEAGTYEVVMDQCEDGKFDPGIDIYLGAGSGFAFKVFLPKEPGEIDYNPVKEAALRNKKVLAGFETTVQISAAAGNQVPGLCFGLDKLVEVGQKLNQVPAGLANAAGVAIEQCNDLIGHYKGIVADPPDPNFTTFAELGPIPYAFASDATAFQRGLRRIFNIIVEQEAITEAFLTTIERVQGAQEADDHEFVSLQLEHLGELIALLVGPGGNLLRYYAALEALEAVVRGDPDLMSDPDSAAFLRTSPEARRAAAGLVNPLGPSFLPDPDDPAAVVPFGLQAWIITYLGLDPFLSFAGLTSIAEFRAASGLPPIGFLHPEAKSTGPYTAPPGRVVPFDALPSTDPNGDPLTYAWDLDMDGLFDDSAAQLVELPFAEPGTRLVGLKVTDPAGNGDVAYIQLKIGDRTFEDIIAIQSRPLDLRRIEPDGTVTTIAQNVIALGGGSPLALQRDVNGDIFIMETSLGSGSRPFLHHLDADGTLLKSLTEAQVEAQVGRNIADTHDIVLDGRGDLLMAAHEVDPAQPGQPNLGPLMVLRLNRDLTSASVVVDGIKRTFGSQPSLAIDPLGRIVISDLTEPDAVTDPNWDGRAGVAVFDPADGSVTPTVPADNALLPNGQGQTVELQFGGVRLTTPHAGGIRNGGGIAVDRQGNYIVGAGQQGLPIDLWRIPIPAQVSTVSETATRVVRGLEIFPLIVNAIGSVNITYGDIGIDAGGDAIIVGRNSGADPLRNHLAAWRVSPAGEVFPVGDLGVFVPGTNQGPLAFDLTREVRDVTVNDVGAPPAVPVLRLDSLAFDQANCPLSATIRATLTNIGSTPVTDPIEVLFYNGDPLSEESTVLGLATAAAPIAPNASVDLSLDWMDPTPGVYTIFALGQGTNAPFTAAMICIPAPPDEAIVLRPLDATLDVGETHTVTGRVFDLYGDPIPGLELSFSVDGANPTAGMGTTDATGTATFSYSGAAPGRDTIGATVFDEVSNQANAFWEQAATLTCDVDGNGAVDIADVRLVLAGRNQAASGPDDPRDADGDGVITVLDARRCVLQCTRPRCAVQ